MMRQYPFALVFLLALPGCGKAAPREGTTAGPPLVADSQPTVTDTSRGLIVGIPAGFGYNAKSFSIDEAGVPRGRTYVLELRDWEICRGIEGQNPNGTIYCINGPINRPDSSAIEWAEGLMGIWCGADGPDGSSACPNVVHPDTFRTDGGLLAVRAKLRLVETRFGVGEDDDPDAPPIDTTIPPPPDVVTESVIGPAFAILLRDWFPYRVLLLNRPDIRSTDADDAARLDAVARSIRLTPEKAAEVRRPVVVIDEGGRPLIGVMRKPE